VNCLPIKFSPWTSAVRLMRKRDWCARDTPASAAVDSDIHHWQCRHKSVELGRHSRRRVDNGPDGQADRIHADEKKWECQKWPGNGRTATIPLLPFPSVFRWRPKSFYGWRSPYTTRTLKGSAGQYRGVGMPMDVRYSERRPLTSIW